MDRWMLYFCNVDYFFDKVFPVLVGSSVGTVIAILGWIVNNILSNKNQLSNFKNQFYEKAFWKIVDEIWKYQKWLSEVNGAIHVFDDRQFQGRQKPEINYLKKHAQLWEYALNDDRSETWFIILSNYEQILPKYMPTVLRLQERHENIKSFILTMMENIKKLNTLGEQFVFNEVKYDKIIQQGNLMAELGSNLQYDCLRPLIQVQPIETDEKKERPYIHRDKKGNIKLAE